MNYDNFETNDVAGTEAQGRQNTMMRIEELRVLGGESGEVTLDGIDEPNEEFRASGR